MDRNDPIKSVFLFARLRLQFVIEGEGFVQKVTKQNVRDAIANIRKLSPILVDLEQQGQLKIVGAVYNMDTGEVDFLEQ